MKPIWFLRQSKNQLRVKLHFVDGLKPSMSAHEAPHTVRRRQHHTDSKQFTSVRNDTASRLQAGARGTQRARGGHGLTFQGSGGWPATRADTVWSGCSGRAGHRRTFQGSRGMASHPRGHSVVGTTADGKLSYELWSKESAQLGKTWPVGWAPQGEKGWESHLRQRKDPVRELEGETVWREGRKISAQGWEWLHSKSTRLLWHSQVPYLLGESHNCIYSSKTCWGF